MDAENLLDQYVPKPTYELVPDLSFHPVYVYRHKPSGLPMACVAGGHAGHIIGGIVYCRAADDSMNMELECITEQLSETFAFVGTMVGKPGGTSMETVWEHFMDNLIRHMGSKKGFTRDGNPVVVVPPSAPGAPSVPLEPTVKHQKVEPCMICLEREPNTMVEPCCHIVVCAECSKKLVKTADANICCQCRCPITGVVYE